MRGVKAYPNFMCASTCGLQSQLVDTAVGLTVSWLLGGACRIYKDTAAKLFTVIGLCQSIRDPLSKMISFSTTCAMFSVSDVDILLRLCTVSVPTLSCWICRPSQLWRWIANDAVICTHRSPWERNLLWKAPVQRLRLASLFGSWQSQEIKAKRWATNVCFCHWRFVCVFDQQPPLSPCLTLLLICSNGLPFMRQEMRAWCEGCDWGEWSRWEETLQTYRTHSWKPDSAHVGYIYAGR